MTRLPYPELSTESESKSFAELAWRVVKSGMPIMNHHRVLASRPPALIAFLQMSEYLRRDTSLSPWLRELAIIGTAISLNSSYVKAVHMPIARSLGLTDEHVAAMTTWPRHRDKFTALEGAVLSYSFEVAARRDAQDATFVALQHHGLSTDQIVDLALTVGWYHLCAAVFGPLRVEVGT